MVQAVAARPIFSGTRFGRRPKTIRGSVLRGRSREKERLGQLLTGIRSGRSGVLVVPRRGGDRQRQPCSSSSSSGRQDAWWLGRRACRPTWSSRSPGCSSCSGRCSARSDRLPGPQREAVEVAFGLRSGPAPDRFEVGLAMLGLLAEVAGASRRSCASSTMLSGLDQASARTLAFVARRTHGRVGRPGVRGARPPDEQTFAGLPELHRGGLNDEDARGVLRSASPAASMCGW